MSEQRILKWLKISYPSYCLTVQCVFLTKKIQSCQTIVDKAFRQSERKEMRDRCWQSRSSLFCYYKKEY